MPLDPTIAAMLRQFAEAGRPALSAGSVADARELMASGRAALGRGPDLPVVTDVSVETRSGPLSARLFRPRSAAPGLIVYLHGGGWVLGTVEDFDAVGRVLARRSGCAVLLPEYRLAPEARFPGPLEDAVDVLAWAARNRAELAGPAAPLVVAGDSAGANLATVAAARLRGEVDLAMQVLIYPVTDSEFDTPSYRDPDNAGLITRADMIWFFDHYAPADQRSSPDVSPLRREDLAGLPPAHVVTAQYDVLRDEGEAYARRLRRAGIATTLRRYDGLPHGFIRLHNHVAAADLALTDIAEVIATTCRANGAAAGREQRGAVA